MNQAPKTANATFCATLSDQLWVNGLRAAFVAPGSRSTPLALALAEHPSIEVGIFHDERSASFAALGYGLASGKPALVLCSSGTAGAHFYAAIIEADAAAVPMIVCTADRPPELWGRGAPQTIDQTELYGSKVRDFVEPGPPDDLDPSAWRPLANRLWAAASGRVPGPVHANLSFRDPLTGTPGELPPAAAPAELALAPQPDPELVRTVANRIVGKRGVLIAGRGESAAGDLVALAERLRWPIVSDHRSGCRPAPYAIHHFDSLFREPMFAARHVPEVVLRVGEIVSSKSTSQWLASYDGDVIGGKPYGRNIDPEAVAKLQFDEHGFVEALLAAIPANVSGCDQQWRESWSAADGIANQVVEIETEDFHSPGEISVAFQVLATAPAGTHIVVSSSMPVRDLEWFAGGMSAEGVTVLANRGANGIDGVLATAIGVALTGVPTACLIGDVAFLHDSSSLTGLARRDIDLTIVVVDNDGGGIFSFLPQKELLGADTFEQLFGTPHGTDLLAMAAAHSVEAAEYDYWDQDPVYGRSTGGPRIVLARTNRPDRFAKLQSINRAVAEKLRTHLQRPSTASWTQD